MHPRAEGVGARCLPATSNQRRMVGYIGQQRDLAMTMCTSALAHARSAWRRRGMSRDPSHEQGIAGAVDVKAGVKDELPNHYKGFLDRYVKYAPELPPCSGPEREPLRGGRRAVSLFVHPPPTEQSTSAHARAPHRMKFYARLEKAYRQRSLSACRVVRTVGLTYIL